MSASKFFSVRLFSADFHFDLKVSEFAFTQNFQNSSEKYIRKKALLFFYSDLPAYEFGPRKFCNVLLRIPYSKSGPRQTEMLPGLGPGQNKKSRKKGRENRKIIKNKRK